jgi:hypothetical protein
MAEPDKRPVTMEELLVSSLAQTDALATLLIEKGSSSEKSLCRRLPTNGRRISGFYMLHRSKPSAKSCFGTHQPSALEIPCRLSWCGFDRIIARRFHLWPQTELRP